MKRNPRRRSRPFRLKGKGTINKEPFALEAAGGALQGLTPQHPYPFDLAVTAGDNQLKATGRVLKPFDLGGLDLDVDATGKDLAELYYLTRLALPNTPPYSVRAHVARRGQRVAVTDIHGKLGDSDIAGTANVDTSRKRPAISGELSSQHLRVADVAAVFGGRASSAGAIEPKGAVQDEGQRARRRHRRWRCACFPTPRCRWSACAAWTRTCAYAPGRSTPAACRSPGLPCT